MHNIICWNCNQKGHFQNQCSKLVASRDKEVNMEARDSDNTLVCCIENTVEDRIIDSSASFHATYYKKELERFKLRSDKVCLAYDKTLDIAGVGDVVLKTSFGTSWTLKDVSFQNTKSHQVIRSRDITFMDSIYEARSVIDSSSLTKLIQKSQVVLVVIPENLEENDNIVAENGLSSKITESPGVRSDMIEGFKNNGSSEDSGRSDEEYSKDGASSKEGGSETPYKKAIIEEMVSLKMNQACSLVRLPAGKNTSQSLWMFMIKEEQDGSKRYKARLMVKDFQQKRGIDYNEIFSPVVKMTTVSWVERKPRVEIEGNYIRTDSSTEATALTWQNLTSLSESKVLQLGKACSDIDKCRVLIFVEDSWNEDPCNNVHQVGDEIEVEVLRSFNWPPSELITENDFLLKRGYSQFNDVAEPQVNLDSTIAQFGTGLQFGTGRAVWHGSCSWHNRIVWQEPEQFSSELNKISLLFDPVDCHNYHGAIYRTEMLYTVQRSVQKCLQAELRSIELGDLSVDAYFRKIESLVTILTSLYSPVNDEDVVHYALEGLPDKYDQVCGIMHHKDTFPDLKTACSMLITEEMRLKSKSLMLPVDSSSPMVFMAESGACRFSDSCRHVHDPSARSGTNNNVSNASSRRTNDNEPTTNELLAKLLIQLGTLGVNNTVTPTPVAFHAGPTTYADPTVGPPSGPAYPHGFSQPTNLNCYTSATVGPNSPLPPTVTIGPIPPSGQTTILPHAFTTETLQDNASGAWNMDTCASSHLNASITSLTDVFNICIYQSISVGDGHTILVTNTEYSVLPTPHKSLHLNNVLIPPTIVKRDLYPVTAPSSIPHAFLVSQHMWHQRLGHPGSEVLRRLLSHNFISYNKDKPPVLCHACQFGKHARFPFVSSNTMVASCFDIIHSDLFRHQYLGDGSLSRYKAHLVANFSAQLEGTDVDETFSLVVKSGTIQTVLSLAASQHWPIHQLDVKNAFLHIVLSKTVYMHQPSASSETLLQRIIVSLHQFSMTGLGSFNYFLGISVTRDSSGMFLSQRKYASEILERASVVNCNLSRTPVDSESKLGDAGDLVSDLTLYRSLTGSLQYLTFTRLDISCAVQQVCLYMHDPREPHFSAFKRILRYVRGTLDYGLHYSHPLLKIWLLIQTRIGLLSYYSAVDFKLLCFFGNNLLSWSSKRQPMLFRSTAEVEYRGVANVVAETCWLRKLLRELHTPLSSATLLYCYNISVVYLSCNPIQHQRTKHIDIDIHFVRDLVAVGQVRVLHVPSRYQYADIFTKGLPSTLFEEFRSSLSVRCPSASTTGEC
nr:ribonuclease H-like domain-containing protein [Tanacetum cinerariifolium]